MAAALMAAGLPSELVKAVDKMFCNTNRLVAPQLDTEAIPDIEISIWESLCQLEDIIEPRNITLALHSMGHFANTMQRQIDEKGLRLIIRVAKSSQSDEEYMLSKDFEIQLKGGKTVRKLTRYGYPLVHIEGYIQVNWIEFAELRSKLDCASRPPYGHNHRS
eukprot:jgi/Picsp_1/4437/NSC_06659-R1_---NA---